MNELIALNQKYFKVPRENPKEKFQYFLSLVERFEKAFPELIVTGFDPLIAFSYVTEKWQGREKKMVLSNGFELPCEVIEYLIATKEKNESV